MSLEKAALSAAFSLEHKKMKVDRVILEGDEVRLEPLEEHHTDALWEIAGDASIWQFMPFSVATREQFVAYLLGLRDQQRSGRALPWATVQRGNPDRVVGATSYLEITPAHKRLEIGATWLTASAQRTAANTEAKLLQLTHAFEVLGCNRVEFKTDSRNTRSRNALARIGAQEEGTFRNHMVMPNGRLRHSTWFSITAEEWPGVKSALLNRLRRS